MLGSGVDIKNKKEPLLANLWVVVPYPKTCRGFSVSFS
jgi:hypothetical protein